MISITQATVPFASQFTQVITVYSTIVDETGTETQVQSTTVPVITKSFDDPGVTVTATAGQVTISGMYRKIIVTNWQYINKQGAIVQSQVTPALGSYRMITKVDSPSKLKETCVYTIDGETFTHTVDMGSYTVVANTLKSLLAAVS